VVGEVRAARSGRPGDEPDELRIRRATTDDAAVLASLGARTFLAAYSPAIAAQDLEVYVRDAFSTGRIRHELDEPGASFLVAEGAEHVRPLGYAHLRVAHSACVPAAAPAELVRLYVDPARTGSGVGAQLLRAALAEARSGGHDVLWLGVWERNLAAQRFYLRWGFTHRGEDSFHLGDEVQTDRIMSRVL
jgi:diamine N-acetyltransferase